MMRVSRWGWIAVAAAIAGGTTGCPALGVRLPATENVAVDWMRLTLNAMEQDGMMPTVEARTLFHVSIAMYDGWAAYDAAADGYVTDGSFKQPAIRRTMANRAETLSHAVYAVLSERFARIGAAPRGSGERYAYEAFGRKMRLHGYLDETGGPVASEAQALGAAIGARVLALAASDGANEANDYADTSGYFSVNPPLDTSQSGTGGIALPNEWQELVVGGRYMEYLTPHWGTVAPFALPPHEAGAVRLDPGLFPQYGGDSEADWIAEMVENIRYSSKMDPATPEGGELFNLSPGARGNLADASHEGTGIPLNPATGQPYADHWVAKGDFLRALSIFLDGKRFTTPAPWWNEVAIDVLTGTGYAAGRPLNKTRAFDLGYDVKLFFALNGALHDAAVATWEVKRAYLGPRPISTIRFLAEFGKLPLAAGLIETIGADDPLAGPNGEHVGGTKLKSWTGADGGVRWIRGEDWLPYQDMDFITPRFPGYTSGHTAFGRAFAQVMTRYTGDAYFPGGLYAIPIDRLRFEEDLSGPVTLQAATYRDIGTDAGLARIYAGVHIPSDVWRGQPIGDAAGAEAYALAERYFAGTAR